MTQTYVTRTELPASIDDAFAWHQRPYAFDRLAPAWVSVTVDERYERLEDGARLVFTARRGGVPIRWEAIHEGVEPPRQFVDVQASGPFRSWRHEHIFEPLAADRCRLVEQVTYELPMGFLGQMAAGSAVERELDKMFAYRQRTLVEDLGLHRRLGLERPLRVAVTGSTGLVGTELVGLLRSGGHEVVRVVRRRPEAEDEVGWVDEWLHLPSRIEGFDAVVDLAGENVASGPWSDDKKQEIRDSRGPRVRRFVDALAELDRPPRAYLCASAIGYYGDTGTEIVDESAPSSSDLFLADVTRGWEDAAETARSFAERVVRFRLGVVLSPRGGALAKLMMPGAGPLVVPGDGRQLVSWVAIDDVAAAILHLLADEDADGAVNLTAPTPVSMANLVGTLGEVTGRPVVAHVPETAIQFGLGQMANETVLLSTGARPTRLETSQYVFRHREVDDALRHLLGRVAA